jgi:hypothetical protein
MGKRFMGWLQAKRECSPSIRQEPGSGGTSEVSIAAGSIFRSAVIGATLRAAQLKKRKG